MMFANGAALRRLRHLQARLSLGGIGISAESPLHKLRAAVHSNESPFFVSGHAFADRSAWLAGRTAASTAVLPFDSTISEELLAAFCSVAEPAAFGRGFSTVLDPAYRSALALSPERVAFSGWSMHEDGIGILHEVHRHLAPTAAGIRAVLAKV